MGYAGTITANGVALEKGATTDALNTSYGRAAIEDQRLNITAVPGSGSVLGVCCYKGVDYAWRNNTGGTAAVMFKSSSEGWAAVDTGHSIDFSVGTAALVAGDLVTGVTSGATCTVGSIQVTSGVWASSTAAGVIHFTTHFGTFVVGEKLRCARLAPTTSADVAVANTAVTWPAGGRYELDIYNFGGHSSTEYLYGANGVGRAFQFDGTNFAFIRTGMTTDTPEHVINHKKHLFLMFAGGSCQHSGTGTPLVWSAITGAAELGLGQDGVGFEKVPGGLLAILCRNKTYILQGSSVADWVLAEHSEVSGAVEWSIQRLTSPLYLDDRGLTSLDAVQEFGNFKDNILSALVQPYIDGRLSLVAGAMVCKEKNQYRLFFTDGSGLYFTFSNHKLVGTTIVEFSKVVSCCWSGEDSAGKERMLFGVTDGYVYRMDSGTSQDGAELVSVMRLAFHHYGSPGVGKRFYSISLEMDLQDALSTDLTLYPDFTFSDANSPRATAQSIDPGKIGGLYGSVKYEEFVWDGSLVGEAFAHIDGHGRNMGILIISTSTYGKPHTIHGATVDYAQRNRRR